MIVRYETPAQKKEARIKLYKDDVFLIAFEAIEKLKPSLSIEELFSSADQFTNFLLVNDLTESEVMKYEINELREEVNDKLSFHLILTLTFVKLCALREKIANAVDVARTLVGFCQEYDGFTDLLKQLFKKEQARLLNNKRVDLLKYELRSIDKAVLTEDGNVVVNAIVDAACGLSVEGMQHVEIALSEANDKFGNQYQKELNCLREARRKKSVSNINIDKLNDIHDNDKVNIGSK